MLETADTAIPAARNGDAAIPAARNGDASVPRRTFQSRWIRVLIGFFGLVVLGTIATMIGSAYQGGSLLAAGQSFEQDAALLATLQTDNSAYAGFVHRYLDGENDPQRAAIRAMVRADFERAVRDLHTPDARQLVQQAYGQWQANDAERRPLDTAVPAPDRLLAHAAATAADGSVMALVDRAAAAGRADFQTDLVQAQHGQSVAMWGGAAIVILFLASMVGLFRRLTRDVLTPVERLSEGAHQIAAGDFRHRIVVDRADELGQLAATFNDMAQALDRSHQSLIYEASHDPLTGLANRRALWARLEALRACPDRRRGTTAVLLLDLDDFKAVNDELGHDGGDELLRLVAARLLEAVRPGDLVARHGGDEFAILLDGGRDQTVALGVARRIVSAFASPFRIAGALLTVGVSIGMAVLGDGSDPDALMRQADQAMYTAKEAGKNRIERYDPADQDAHSADHGSETRAPQNGLHPRGHGPTRVDQALAG